jgi:MraZ protein
LWEIEPSVGADAFRKNSLNHNFVGISALSLDAKGRMTIPTRHRDALMQDSAGQLVLMESDSGCLLLMTQRLWAGRIASITEDDADEERRRFWLGLSDTPEIDSAGRVLINPVLREGAGISREVMLLGVGPHFEVWDATRLALHKEAVRARKMRGAN